MITMRLRSRIGTEEMESKVGKILTDDDYNVLLTGAATVLKPNGAPLCVYLPGELTHEVDAGDTYPILHSLRTITTDNRGAASGSPRVASKGTQTRARHVASSVIGAMDAAGRQRYCRLTAWTGKNVPHWQALAPLLRAVAARMQQHVPDRYAAQLSEAQAAQPEWVVPGTPFTTVTVNNSYPTGVHTDKGDLERGFSTIACLRRGSYTGGRLTFPLWRVAVDLHHGDLILMDAHDWHGNTMMVCACGQRMNGMCDTCGADRSSVVSYYRENISRCGSADQEYARAQQAADARTDKTA